MPTVTLILLLLLMVALSGVIVRFIPVPLPIVQIVLGVVLAIPARGLQVELNPEIFMLVFIPPLLFLDGHLAPKREFREFLGPILSLAFGLSLFTTIVFGYALNWLIPVVPLPVAFALAAVLSPTDPVAVGSIIDKDGFPGRVRHVLEGESLLNDATGLVIFRFAVAAALTGQFSFTDTAASFVAVVAGGVFCGVATFWATAFLLGLITKAGDVRPQVQVVLLLLLPFAAYLLAEFLDASGILAAVAAGLSFSASGLLPLQRMPISLPLTAPARMQNAALNELVSFVFNGAIFIVLGLQLPEIVRRTPPELSIYGSSPEPILAVIILTLILLLIRYLWIDSISSLRGLVHRRRGTKYEHLTLVGKIIMALAGVRGAITLAGILSLPLSLPDGSPFPARDVAIYIAAGVIICSLVIASLTLPVLARKMPLESGDVAANEERLARVTAAEAAIRTIEELAGKPTDDASEVEARRAVASQLISLYRQRIIAVQGDTPSASETSPILSEMREAALAAERIALLQLTRDEKINDTTMRQVMAEVTMQQALHQDNGRRKR